MLLYRYVIHLLFFFYCCQVFAQQDALIQYTLKDGLPSDKLHVVHQDQAGFLWIGTDNGLCRFDGTRFKTYRSPLLKDNIIINLFEDRKGRVWFVNLSKKLFYIQEDNIHQYDLSFLSDDIKIDYFLHAEDEIWLQTVKQGVFRVSDVLEKPEIKGHYFSEQTLNHLFLINDNIFYYNNFFHNNEDGYYAYYDRETDEFVQIETGKAYQSTQNSLPKNQDDNICLDNPNMVFVTYPKRGIIIRQNEVLRPFLAYEPIKSIKQLEDETFVISNSKGGFHFDAQFNPVKEIGKGNSVLSLASITEDVQKHLWFGTQDQGLFKSFRHRAMFWNKSNSSLDQETITNIVQGPEGHIFVTTNGGGLLLFKNNEIKKQYNLYEEIQLPYTGKEQFYSINVSDADELQVCFPFLMSIKNVMTKQPKFESIKVYNSKGEEYLKENFKFLYKDIEAKLWVATAKNTAVIVNEKQHKKVLLNRTYHIFQSANDSIWLGTTQGLYQVAGDTAHAYMQQGLNFRYNINDITEDRDSSLWVSTPEGVFCIKQDTVLHFTEKHGLSSNTCNDLYIDSQNNVWVATTEGITKLIYPDYSAFIIDEQDGLIYKDVSCIYKDEIDNNIWAGTSRGLYIIEDFSAQQPYQPPIYITEVNVNDNIIISNTEKLELNHDQNRLYFEFVGVDLGGKMKYQYRLKNHQEKWIETDNPHALFSSLSAGDYIFEVKAMHKNGGISKDAAVVRFVIYPHWAKTNWFITFVIFSLIITMLIMAYFREKYVKKQAAEKMAVNKKIARLELQALRSQMNPHFIFNALNAIQSFIFDRQEQTARNYLVKFSRLIRAFLESSRTSYISLEEEMELLRNYVELEQLRFPDKFDFRIEVDKRLNPFIIDVPTMLLQPFIENAINHGLYYKKEKGQLLLSIQKKDAFLNIIIEDNGVGRAKAAAYKKRATNSYKSRGMEILNDRIKTIKRIEEYDISVDIIDLKDVEDNACGTKITIAISLEE